MDAARASLDRQPSPDVRWTFLAVAVYSPRSLIGDVLSDWLGRTGFRVVGRLDDLAALGRLCGARHPDLVIVDAGTDFTAVVAPLTELRAAHRRIRTVVIYDELSPRELVEAHRAGVGSLVPSTVHLKSFYLLLHRLAATAVLPEPAVRVADRELTTQERETLGLLSAGHSVRHIATLLNTSLGAVEGCKRRIYAKLRVSSQSQAVARAIELGLVDTREPAATTAERARPPELTAREFDILRSIARGDTVRQTARMLAIAEKTVENLKGRLFLKLGTHNRAGAIRAAYALGLLDLSLPARTTPASRPSATLAM